jgi:hypothetical protein
MPLPACMSSDHRLFDSQTTCTSMASDPTKGKGGYLIVVDDSTDEHQMTEVKFVFKNVSDSNVENALHACHSLQSKDGANPSSA